MQLQNWKWAQGNINGGHGLPNDEPYSFMSEIQEQQRR